MKNKIKPGKKIVIIGAGNVGCDVATEAHRLGAREITMIDVQKPAAFGKEREDAEACGATFKWPCFTKKITKQSVVLQDGEILKADTVVVSIGDVPDLDFIDESITTKNGFVFVDKLNRTSDPKVFAIGDVSGPGLITDAIGDGRRTAISIDRIIAGKNPECQDTLPSLDKPVIDKSRINLAYYSPRNVADSLSSCGDDCASCGQCKDCGICVAICPESAITRIETKKRKKGSNGNGNFEYQVDPELCIGCGFCKGACPCGIWEIVPNPPV